MNAPVRHSDLHMNGRTVEPAGRCSHSIWFEVLVCAPGCPGAGRHGAYRYISVLHINVRCVCSGIYVYESSLYLVQYATGTYVCTRVYVSFMYIQISYTYHVQGTTMYLCPVHSGTRRLLTV